MHEVIKLQLMICIFYRRNFTDEPLLINLFCFQQEKRIGKGRAKGGGKGEEKGGGKGYGKAKGKDGVVVSLVF